jgi:hypothetical protein
MKKRIHQMHTVDRLAKTLAVNLNDLSCRCERLHDSMMVISVIAEDLPGLDTLEELANAAGRVAGFLEEIQELSNKLPSTDQFELIARDITC